MRNRNFHISTLAFRSKRRRHLSFVIGGLLFSAATISYYTPVPLCQELSAKKVVTTIRKKNLGKNGEGAGEDGLKSEKFEIRTPQDSARWLPGFIFSGYDKTLTSATESFFITNRSGRRLLGAVLDIDYLDMSGRQLHRRTVEITCDIPDGETRKVDIPTFDRQHSFYYRLSQSPRRQASPFDVTIRILTLMLDAEC